jgi:hypothetical protein
MFYLQYLRILFQGFQVAGREFSKICFERQSSETSQGARQSATDAPCGEK